MWETTRAKLWTRGRMMKLLKQLRCSYRNCRGNVKLWTTLVEGQGIGFWTRVRLPSSPLRVNVGEPCIWYLSYTGIWLVWCIRENKSNGIVWLRKWYTVSLFLWYNSDMNLTNWNLSLEQIEMFLKQGAFYKAAGTLPHNRPIEYLYGGTN